MIGSKRIKHILFLFALACMYCALQYMMQERQQRGPEVLRIEWELPEPNKSELTLI